MIYIYPDFYFDFQCKADKCLHSCCKNWEIDIDDESISRFKNLPENESAEIFANILDMDGSCFKLKDDGCCPFLEDSGLCRLIKKYNEDFVPYICREHPRFYNEYETYCECGLGLSCEETVSLICEEDYLDYIFQDSCDCEILSDEMEFINWKYDLIDDISNSDDILQPLFERYDIPQKISLEHLINAYSSIETLLPHWQGMLENLRERLDEAEIPVKASPQLRAFAQYLIFRHLVNDNCKEIALFIALSILVCSLLIDNGNSILDVLREFSSEIEYSDENIDSIIKTLIS